VEEVVADIGGRIAQRATLARAVGTVPAYLVNAILVVFFLVWGRRFWEGFLRQLPDDDRRDRIATAVTTSIARGRWYVLAVLAQGAVLGTVAGLVSWLLELPAPAVLGLTVAVSSLVPYIGIVLGAVPALLVAAASEPAWVTAALAAGAVLAQAAAVVLAGRVIHPRSVHVGPAPIVLAALLGAAIYGAGGAGVLVVLVIVGVAALDRRGAASSSALPAPEDPF
jgi:predicted PurR-regulated permease PerM